MGIHSTIRVTRSKAIEVLIAQLEQKIQQLTDDSISFDNLESMLNEYVRDRFCNVIVVLDDENNDNDQLPNLE